MINSLQQTEARVIIALCRYPGILIFVWLGRPRLKDPIEDALSSLVGSASNTSQAFGTFKAFHSELYETTIRDES